MEKPSFEILRNAVLALQEQDAKEERWFQSFNEMLDGRFVVATSTTLQTEMVKLLQYIFKDEYDWIPYWIWESKYGETAKVWENEVEVPIKELSDFYQFLINEYFSDDNSKSLSEQGNTLMDK